MKIIAVLPARMAASRFPGKPLASILGMPMLGHCYHRARLCERLDEVCIATCDEEIRDYAEQIGARCIMTADTHERCSERVAEAAASLDADVIVLIQGDEPMITPEMIEAAIAPMIADASIPCVNLTSRIETVEEWESPNTIKVVMDLEMNALYFTREPVPHAGKLGFEAIPRYKQVCVIPFRSSALARYVELEQTPLEKAESVDMMRFLENGIPVRMVEMACDSHAVDTPADLVFVEERMAGDPLLERYRGAR